MYHTNSILVKLFSVKTPDSCKLTGSLRDTFWLSRYSCPAPALLFVLEVQILAILTHFLVANETSTIKLLQYAGDITVLSRNVEFILDLLCDIGRVSVVNGLWLNLKKIPDIRLEHQRAKTIQYTAYTFQIKLNAFVILGVFVWQKRTNA